VITLVHIINPVKVTQSSPLFTAQPLVFESMRLAKSQAESLLNIEQVAVCFEEDVAVIPGFFTALPLTEALGTRRNGQL
jgi:hypothetical protein